jgi:hypothetical protein
MIKENYSTRYKQSHRKELAKKQREYIKNHPVNWNEHYQKYRDGYVRRAMEKHNKIKREIFDLLGNKCINPYNINHGDFIQDIRCLQIDHVHGGGSKEIKRMKSPFKYYEFILKKIKVGSKDYQLLCANCNQIKRKINKENRTIKG